MVCNNITLYVNTCKCSQVQLCYLHIKGTKHFRWHFELGGGNIMIVGQLIPWTFDPMPFLTWVDVWSHIVLPDWTFGPILHVS